MIPTPTVWAATLFQPWRCRSWKIGPGVFDIVLYTAVVYGRCSMGLLTGKSGKVEHSAPWDPIGCPMGSHGIFHGTSHGNNHGMWNNLGRRPRQPLQHAVRHHTGWFRLNAQNCVPGNSSRRFFELDHEILHTYSGRQYLKLEEGFFFIWGFAVEISGF